MSRHYSNKEEVYTQAKTALGSSLRELIPAEKLVAIEEQIAHYNNRRKGFLGNLVEEFVFDLEPNSRAEADFHVAGVEVKATPLKNSLKKRFVSKERLVFSMINYNEIVRESWETSSFLEKNKLLLLMFYLWLRGESILDHKFKFVHLLDLLKDVSESDILQIKKDWEFIVSKIKRGEAHLLSEADTFFLGACTKAANSRVVRDQPNGARTPAKPRAFSLKQQYLNYLIQKHLLGADVTTDSILKRERRAVTVEELVSEKFRPYIGRTDSEIKKSLKWDLMSQPKNYKRLLANRILGVKSNNIEELDKANVTLRVVTLESTGKLTESISFPTFDYKELVTQVWYDESAEDMSEFHAQLETKKFLFVIFQKVKGSDDIILRRIKFWNFPMSDLPEAQRVWERAVDCVREGRYEDLPKMSESLIMHVRPHGRNAKDVLETPQGTKETKRCFWLNAKYIERILNE